MHLIMRFCFSTICLITLAMAATPSIAQEAQSQQAPLGLAWGASISKIKLLGVELSPAPIKDYGASFIATKLPKVIADTATVLLSFGNDDRLWRITVLSRPYRNDPYGNAVMARYRDLAGILTEKYGKGTEFHHIDHELWTKPSQFVMGLSLGRSQWFTTYNTPSLAIEISIIGSSSDEADWRIIFENKGLRAQFNTSTRAKEKNAL